MRHLARSSPPLFQCVCGLCLFEWARKIRISQEPWHDIGTRYTTTRQETVMSGKGLFIFRCIYIYISYTFTLMHRIEIFSDIFHLGARYTISVGSSLKWVLENKINFRDLIKGDQNSSAKMIWFSRDPQWSSHNQITRMGVQSTHWWS